MDRLPPGFPNQRSFPQKSNEPPKESSNKIYWILGVIFLVALSGLVYIFIIASNNKNIPSDFDENITEPSQLPSEVFQSMILCEDWDCFVDASKECKKANFTSISSFEFFGLNITTTTYYELKGLESEKCVFYLRTEEQHINLTDELIQQMMNNN